ncbi:hypothetical protein D3C86_1335040 [compost metagenome]
MVIIDQHQIARLLVKRHQQPVNLPLLVLRGAAKIILFPHEQRGAGGTDGGQGFPAQVQAGFAAIGDVDQLVMRSQQVQHGDTVCDGRVIQAGIDECHPILA